jgi:hypothetical protein
VNQAARSTGAPIQRSRLFEPLLSGVRDSNGISEF